MFTHPQEGRLYDLSSAKECIAAALSDLSSHQPGSAGGADALGMVQLLAAVAPALRLCEAEAGSGAQVQWLAFETIPLFCTGRLSMEDREQQNIAPTSKHRPAP